MKLPENKAERIRLIVLGAVACIIFVILVTQFVARPFFARWGEIRATRAEIQEKIEKAEAELAKMRRNDVEFRELTAQLDRLSKEHVIQPVLGTYLLGVQERIENLAATCGVKIESVKETGIMEIPGMRGLRERAVRSYGVQVSASAGYEALLRLFQALETSNPYVCISGLSIVAVPDTPERHRITFRVQWPVWRDPTNPFGKRNRKEG